LGGKSAPSDEVAVTDFSSHDFRKYFLIPGFVQLAFDFVRHIE